MIYMFTHRQTQKFQNLTSNPAVSLMIDTPDTAPRKAARAMTVEGVFQKIADSTKDKEVRQKLISAHPHLGGFMAQPEAEVFQINIKSFLLLDGLTRSFFQVLPDSGA